jgi:cytochrome P450
MSAATYFLTTHPDALARATAEVRESFASDDDINLSHDVPTPYVQAVVEETLRLFPAAAVGTPRVINEDGEIVDGKFIPPGVSNLAPLHVRTPGFPSSFDRLLAFDLVS